MSTSMIVRDRTQGDRRWFLGGGVHVWKLTAEETDGNFLLFEDFLSEGKVTPLHLHPETAETLYVLEGAILAVADGQEQAGGQGGVIMIAKGVPHAFRVTSKEAHLLCLQTPGNGEQFYRAASEPSTADSGPVDFARLGQLAREHRDIIEILGPPPFGRS